MLEAYATTRVRKDGKQEDRVTGNLVWYGVEHAETRPTVDPRYPAGHKWHEMPLPDRHVHCFIPNVTFDEQEQRWKAVKFRPIMDIRKYFDRCYDSILARRLTDLGYETETEWNDKGKYYSWDIKGIPGPLKVKNSRRSVEIDALEAQVAADRKEAARLAGVPGWETMPDTLSAVAADKLGGTSRREKRDDLTLGGCREYWATIPTEDEAVQVAATIERARLGLNPKLDHRAVADAAMDFALRHHSEQQSAFRWEELAATALEHGMGAATPAEIEAAAKRAGVLFVERDGLRMATTVELQAEEDYLIGVAWPGRGVVPVGVPDDLRRGKLNEGQWQAVCGLLISPNRVNMIEGPAGAGKSSLLASYDRAMKSAGEAVTYLATTAKAVEVLRVDGFKETQTLARFLVDEKMQAAAKGGRIVIDETSMLGHKDAVKLFRLAEKLDLKLVCVGDAMQHGSVAAGNFHKLMKEYGGIKPFKLWEIMRQEDAGYRKAADLLSKGKTVEGFDALDRKKWVREIESEAERCEAIAADYLKALAGGETALVVSPTHKEAAAITAAIRSGLREAGTISGEERRFLRLVAADASVAERGLAQTYRPGDVLQFHQNAKGGYKSGQKLLVGDVDGVPLSEASKFQLYRPESIGLAVGDRIRFTASVRTLDGGHKFTNGDTATVAGFDREGNIRLAGGKVVGKDAGHFRHAFVETSFGSQGQTVKRVILGMSSHSTGAMNAEQLYVSATRGKKSVTVYTDDKESVREAVQRSSQKLLASDLRTRPAKPNDWLSRPRDWRKDKERKRRHEWFDRLRQALRRRFEPSSKRPEPTRRHTERTEDRGFGR